MQDPEQDVLEVPAGRAAKSGPLKARGLRAKLDQPGGAAAMVADLAGNMAAFERNFDAVVDAFGVTGNENALIDLLLAKDSVFFNHLSLVLRIGQLAISADRFRDFHIRAAASIRAGAGVRFRQFETLGRGLAVADPRFRLLLYRLKYAGIRQPKDRSALFANAAILAERVELFGIAFDTMFERRRDKSLDRDAWDREVRMAYAVQHIIADAKIAGPGLVSAVDKDAARDCQAGIDTSRGALLLLCHASFAAARLSFIDVAYPDSAYMASSEADARRIAAHVDPRAALFAGLKALMQKKVLLLAPDGKQGALTSSINVFGKTVMIGDGAAFLAYESRCAVYFYAMNRSAKAFVPTVVAGPVRASGEKFAAYRERFLAFYEKMLNDFFAGDPRNLVLTPQWLKIFGAGPN
jgi:hypothetical protein